MVNYVLYLNNYSGYKIQIYSKQQLVLASTLINCVVREINLFKIRWSVISSYFKFSDMISLKWDSDGSTHSIPQNK